MELIRKEEYDAFIDNEFRFPVIVRNNVIEEEWFVMLEPSEVKQMDFKAIRDFVINRYASKFDSKKDVTIYYYGKTDKTL